MAASRDDIFIGPENVLFCRKSIQFAFGRTIGMCGFTPTPATNLWVCERGSSCLTDKVNHIQCHKLTGDFVLI